MIRGINHITISVHDIDAAFLFYKDFLGFRPVMKSVHSAYLEAGSTWIALVLESMEDGRVLYSHIAFACPDEEMERYRARMAEAGVLSWQENRTEGDSLYILDPSGNKLELHSSDLASRVEFGKANWTNSVEWF